MSEQDNQVKVEVYQNAVDQFIQRLQEDRYVLAVVLVGSLTRETIWWKDAVRVWIIETDGVTRRLRADGDEPRVFRTFTEAGVNIHAEIISRSRFRRMVEGNSRTTFSCSFFAVRELIYCSDKSIEAWFDQANSAATTDQEKELLVVSTWVIWAHRHAVRRLAAKNDVPLAAQEVLHAAHAVAHLEIVRHGEVWEQEAIYRAIEYEPQLFQTIYLDVITKRKSKKVLTAAFERIDEYLDQHAESDLRPLLKFLRRESRVVPLSEIADHFAHSQLYPWHLEYASEWLERKGRLEKVSAPFQITKKSLVEVEEPAYFLSD